MTKTFLFNLKSHIGKANFIQENTVHASID